MKNGNAVFWALGIISVLIIRFTLWFNYIYATGLGKDYQGLFGDMFGASNALFTGLSFVGVIIAILLQSQELKLQRNELQSTREEFATQNSTMKLQQFENTFFQMLNYFNSIVNDLNIIDKEEHIEIKGRSVFDVLKLELLEISKKKFYKENPEVIENGFQSEKMLSRYMYAMDISKLNEVLNTLNYSNKEILFTYYRTLYQILKFIHKTANIDKRDYFEFILAQFTQSEINMLCYFALSDKWIEELKPLIEEYHLLKNFKEGGIGRQIIETQYKTSAFN